MFGGRKSQPAQSATPPAPPAVNSTPSNTPGATNARPPVGFETVLGANTTVKGELRSKTNVRIDGNFEGSLEIDGNIFVGETARIVADIQSRNEVKVAGAVRGNINGRKVHLSRTGRVWGDISTGSLTADDGAYIEGKITMVNHPANNQGFTTALPAPEVAVLQPMAEDAVTGDPVEAELMDDEPPAESGNANSGQG